MGHTEFTEIEKLQKVDVIKNIEFLGNDFAIFDNTGDFNIPPYKYTKINAAVFAICTDGSKQMIVNGHHYNIGKNQVIAILPSSVVCNISNDKDFKAQFIAMNPQFIDETIPKLDRILPVLLYLKDHPCTIITDEELQRLKEFYAFMWQRIKTTDIVYKKEVVVNLLKALLYEIAGIFKKHINYTPEQSRQSEIFVEFMKLCFTYFRTERSLQFYADKLCISPKYLSVVVKQVSSKTASEWIDDYVLNEAKTLLKTSNKTIQQISYELNFANQSFFGKFFKRKTGVTPGHFKKA